MPYLRIFSVAPSSPLRCCLSQYNDDSIILVQPMEDYANEPDVNYGVPVFKVLDIDVCARAILDYVPIGDLVRSERVCRRWQSAIHDYMQSEHTVSFYDLFDRNATRLAKYGSKDNTGSCSTCSLHRRIHISTEAYSVSLACTVINKWGHSMVNVFTARQDEEYFELIAEKCKYLQCLKFVGQKSRKQNCITKLFQSNQIRKNLNFALHEINKCKQLKMIAFKHIFDLRDEDMTILLQNINYEELEICDIRLYGYSLQLNKHNSLKFLNISCMWTYFLVYNLVDATKNMQNLKSLTLDSNYLAIFNHVHIIVKELPKLEDLSLCNYYYDWILGLMRCDNNNHINDFTECLSQLKNLKRLFLRNNETVDDEMLEALAKCRKLEYLDISNDDVTHMFWSSRGVAALCVRPPPAVTTLCLGYIQNMHSLDLLNCVRNVKTPMVQELEHMGCLEFTPKWLENASKGSMLRMYPLEVEAITMPTLTEESYPDLKVVLSRAHHNEKQ